VVTDLIDRYDISENSLLLDPFCGTGTTLVAAKGTGIDSIGIDSNPAAVLASNVKTDWSLSPLSIVPTVERLKRRFKRFRAIYDPARPPTKALVRSLRTYLDNSAVLDRVGYFEDSGMLERRWMFELPMLQSFALMHMIETSRASAREIQLLRLLLTAAVQESIANIGFGPELYVKKTKLLQPKDAWASFELKVDQALEDLRSVRKSRARSKALAADSRSMESVLEPGSVTHVITSPPYPTEKDYTRNSRLELVFLGFVQDRASLQSVKREMIRSHSKGIYKTDTDSELVTDVPSVQALADELREKAAEKTYGFAKLYPLIITEYFGGMRRHLRSLKAVMADGGIGAYVVGEQTCYLQTFTPTATILGEIAEREGFELKEILPFRVRTGSTGGGRPIKEEVLVIRA
jgi:DNA modification methylase